MGANTPFRTTGRERGFAVLWVLMFVTLVVVIAAAAAPYLHQAADLDRVQRTAQILSQVTDAVDSFTLVVKRGGASWTTPNNLTQLSSTIVSGGPAGCTTQTYNGTAVTNWTANAPFGGQFVVDANGIWTPIGRINIAPSRTPNTVGTRRTSTSDPYYLQMESVNVALARELDVYVDTTPSQTAGLVQYTAPAADSTTVVSYDVTLAHSPAC